MTQTVTRNYRLFAALAFLLGVSLLGMATMTQNLQWDDYTFIAYVGSIIVGVVGAMAALQALLVAKNKTKSSFVLLLLNGLLAFSFPLYMVLGGIFLGP
ncbi:hypothetical protein [Paenibacillus arenosi]|uniref:DUF4064 domain-containing protein n=1 Tax=Paenibacillus arenosi TaxID=2774142 RepID=A0ABR9B559_9BACL|nr:hypothetical protein [Paenibacillus arenosi]MBD8501128.1 hypothetical protein [Paenibacillus arenosi]